MGYTLRMKNLQFSKRLTVKMLYIQMSFYIDEENPTDVTNCNRKGNSRLIICFQYML